MKEQKPLTNTGPGEGQGSGGSAQDSGASQGLGQRAQDSGSAEVPPRQRPMMQNDIQTRNKRRGRLGRDVQTKLGKTLQAYFDDVVKEGVPDRFKDLLQQFDERKDKGSS
jgi:hypothetical protein